MADDRLPVPVVAGYDLEETPLRGKSKRRDIIATRRGHEKVTPDRRGPWLRQARQFFAGMNEMIDQHAGDPVALGQALARIDTLTGDLRYLRDRLRDGTAAALDEHQVRRLVITGVCTLEAASSLTRSDWQHVELLRDVLLNRGWRLLTDDGELVTAGDAAAALLEFFRPDWRLTQLREVGINPDGYCTVDRDEDGKYVRTPGVKVADNRTKWDDR